MTTTLGTGTPIASLPAGPSAAAAPSPPSEPPTLVTVPKRFASLQYVFDDPAEGEPGKDRLVVHALWEIVLAVALVGGCLLLHGVAPVTFQSAGLPALALSVAYLCVLGTAVGLSLRTGAVNLSVGAVMVAAATYVGEHPGSGFGSGLAIAVALAAAFGAVLGLVVVGLHVPAWAASLGGFMAVSVWVAIQDGPLVSGNYDPVPDAYWWFGCAAGLSVVAGIVGTWRTVRRGLGRFRPVADPAQRRGGVAAAVVVGSFVVSTMLAAVVGGLAVAMNRPIASSDGITETALALGVALLGGTSAFGRRGGVFGTLLAAALVVVFIQYAQRESPRWTTMAFAAVAVGVGLAVTRLVERYGRPVPGKPLDDRPAANPDWAPKQHSASAAQPSLWGNDDAWGTPSTSR
jgi:ribose/xylose/arabinose/galactoside ABC-type transport system permease subunit